MTPFADPSTNLEGSDDLTDVGHLALPGVHGVLLIEKFADGRGGIKPLPLPRRRESSREARTSPRTSPMSLGEPSSCSYRERPGDPGLRSRYIGS